MQKAMVSELGRIKLMDKDLLKCLMVYKFAIDEVLTKINILNEEFKYIHDYNPIESICSRVKSTESILTKARRKGYPLSISSIKENVRDIAGIRITCSFITDVYTIFEMLQNQKDIEVVHFKDYIKTPKANGYQSFHMIVKIPVFLSDRVENTFVEIQIRTIAMDFWASLEHKIYYKFEKDIPERLIKELRETALSIKELDKDMERIHREVTFIKEQEENPRGLTLCRPYH